MPSDGGREGSILVMAKSFGTLGELNFFFFLDGPPELGEAGRESVRP